VRRGEILLDLRILDRWDDELDAMNKGKEGGQYVYPEIFITLLGYVRLLFHLPLRQTEGFMKALRRFDSRIRVPDYSTIDRRVNKLDVKLIEKDYGDDIVLAVDGSGIKVSNRGERMDTPQMEGQTRILEDPHRRRCETEKDSRLEGDR
jgi:hypothetical protein